MERFRASILGIAGFADVRGRSSVGEPGWPIETRFFVQASIPSEKEEKTIFLPERAVNYRYGVYKVFLVSGNRVSERQIRPAGQTEDRTRRFCSSSYSR